MHAFNISTSFHIYFDYIVFAYFILYVNYPYSQARLRLSLTMYHIDVFKYNIILDACIK